MDFEKIHPEVSAKLKLMTASKEATPLNILRIFGGWILKKST